MLVVLATLRRPPPLLGEGREDLHADIANAAAPGTGFLIAVRGWILLGIQQGGLLKIKKAGVSFKSLESSSGSLWGDTVRGMEGEREGEAAGEKGSRDKEWVKEGVGETGWKYSESIWKEEKEKGRGKRGKRREHG